jgi:hypothetical protein
LFAIKADKTDPAIKFFYDGAEKCLENNWLDATIPDSTYAADEFDIAKLTYTVTPDLEAEVSWTLDEVAHASPSNPLEAGTWAMTVTVAAGEDNNEAVKWALFVITEPAPQPGSEALPYSVAEARAAIDAGTGITDVYAVGYVSKIVTEFSSQYNNVSFNISDDGLQSSDQLQGFRTSVTSASDVSVGDKVVLHGSLVKYNSTYEFEAGNTITSRTQGTLDSVAVSGTPTKTEYSAGESYNHNGLAVIATLTNGAKMDVTANSTWHINPSSATVGDTEVEITATYNDVTSPVFIVNVTVSSAAPTYVDATMTAGTNGSACTINNIDGIKVGTSKNDGNMTITVPAGTVELKLYVVAWKGAAGTVNVSTSNGTLSSASLTLTADDGLSNNSPFTLNADLDTFVHSITLTGVTAQATITISSGTARRFAVWGAQYRLGN